MATLNNIWYFLISEHNLFCRIIVEPTVIIELWLAFLLTAFILKIEYTPRQKYSYIFGISITSFTTEFIIKSPYNVILNYLTMFLILRFYFNLNLIKSILGVFIPTTVFALIGNLILNPFLTILNITYSQIENIVIYRLLYLFTLYSIVFIVIKLTKFKKINIHLIEDISIKNQKLIILNLCLAILTLSIELIITFYYINTYSLIFTLLNFISLLAYCFISFYSLTKTLNLQLKTKELENAEAYNNTLTYLYDNVKAFKHDFNNMIFIIGGYIETNDMIGLKKYYIQLENDCERVNEIEILNPKIINNPGIYNLLIAKYNKAQSQNIKISLEYFFDFEKLKMPIYEFARVLGILLDNALEAAYLCKNKEVRIMFRDSSLQRTQIIKIENTYSNKNLDTSKIFEKGISEKENHMGMGLWEVQQIINRNNNVNIITSKNDNYFTQQLEIYY